MVFAIKILSAKQYKHFTGDVPAVSTSAIVVVFREDKAVFEQCLQSLKKQKKLNELIVVVDEREKGKYEDLLESLQIGYIYAAPGKREALVKGIQCTKGDIIFLIDSDSILSNEDVIIEMLKPFHNDEIGGVTPRQQILNPSSIFEDIADWMEDTRWTISNRAMSAKGCIGCLPGRVLAFRRMVIEPHLSEFLNETFLGRRCIIGDDRFLTSITLRAGYKTVYQSTATIYTTCPKDFTSFVKMHLRWARSSQRETIKALRWYLKKPFILPFSFITDIITPFFFMAVLIHAFANIVLHFDPTPIISGTFYDSLLIGGSLGYIGMNLSLGLRQFQHLKKKKEDIPFLFFWTIFISFIMMPIRILGFFTMTKQDWMTRYEDAKTIKSARKNRSGLLIIILLVLACCTILGLLLILAASANRTMAIY